MRRILILFAFAITSASLLSANQGATYSDNDDFRAKGLIIRPELYGALLVDIGYQINPRLQVSFGFGPELDFSDNHLSIFDLIVGGRAYATPTKWTAFFDYHLGVSTSQGIGIITHRFTLGPSYKNFDFGAGIMHMSASGESATGPVITLGYNFRF